MKKLELLDLQAHSCGLKPTMSSSKDTGLFCPPELQNFLELEENNSIVFTIYKEDCLKALLNIINSLPLYTSKSGKPFLIEDNFEFFTKNHSSIIGFFGDADSKNYGPLTKSTITQNRVYLYGWDKLGLNIRNLFIANNTSLFFEKESGNIALRFITKVCKSSNNTEDIMSNTHIIDKPQQIIYFGAPGTGKSHTIKEEYGISKNNSCRTTFHPDSDYSSFVGCYKPTKEKDEDKGITYEFVPQVFTEAYIAAWRNYADGNPIFLIIEEINRGNCAQIFGDLFQLLDRNEHGFSDYEIRPEKDLMQYLKEEFEGKHNEDGKHPELKLEDFPNVINGEELLLPPNLNILATMNTSDQSLFPIDSAFKRRWEWRYIAIKDAEKNFAFIVDGVLYDWWKFVKYVNDKIKDVTSSEDKKMGYFFVKPNKKANENDKKATIITHDVFVSKVLFYLWTDIFKDYADDVENNIFRKKLAEKDENGKDKYVPMSFTDFFDDKGIVDIQTLKDFLAQFDDLRHEQIKENNPDEEDSSTSSISSRALKPVIINGTEYNLHYKYIAKQVMEIYIQNNPNLSAIQVINNWKN